uniref:8-AzgI n=1 Tax=Streptomyces pathocidini TaxID=1650571 RepID=A0A7G3ZQC7_9ACTN|nr:8-AzgI [Streptomyces pathocidini]
MNSAREAARNQGIDPANYDYLFVDITKHTGCNWGAQGSMPGNWIVSNAEGHKSWMWMHEFGHNLGFNHPLTLRGCPVSGDVTRINGSCTQGATDDPGDPVGGGGKRLYPASYRQYAGWLSGSQMIPIRTSGSYQLGVLGKDGVQEYRIDRGNGSTLSLEFRRPKPPYDDFASDDPLVNGVTVRIVSGDGRHNTLVDATPATSSTKDAPLAAGKILVDEVAKAAVRVCSVGDNGADLRVAIGDTSPADCKDTEELTAPTVAKAEITGVRQSTGEVVRDISGTGVPGAIVQFLRNDGRWENNMATVEADGTWSRINTVYGADDGVTVRQTKDGETSDASPKKSYTIAKPTIALAEIRVNGANSELSYHAAGKGVPGARIQVANASGGWTDRNVVGGDGSWSFSGGYGNAFARVRQVLDGITSAASDDGEWKVPTPTISSAQITGVDGSGKTQYALEGTGLAHTTVQIRNGSSWVDSVKVGQDGKWSVAKSTATQDTSGAVVRVAGSIGGVTHYSAASAKKSYTIAKPTITSPGDGATVQASFTAHGKGVSGAQVSAKIEGVTKSVTVNANGDWTVDFTGVAGGKQELSVSQSRDGLVSPAERRNITVAGSAPGTPPSSCGGAPAWDSSKIYWGGDLVFDVTDVNNPSAGYTVYRAAWWNVNVRPVTNNGPWGKEWILVGTCQAP